jgi:hypothetical protein
MGQLKTYSDIPCWIKELVAGNTLILYFPRRNQVIYSRVISNFMPKSSEYLAILTVCYSVNGIEKIEELLYDNYYINQESDNSWKAFQIM